jgi:uncharacterized protein (DUF2384 family)
MPPTHEDILAMADQIFGSIAKADEWMLGAQSIFNGESPIAVCRTGAGRQRVLNLLGQIEHNQDDSE